MKTSKAFFLFGYALFMAVFAGIFSLVWCHWPVPAPDIFIGHGNCLSFFLLCSGFRFSFLFLDGKKRAVRP